MVEHGKGNFVNLILSMIKHKIYSCEWIETIMKRKITILFFKMHIHLWNYYMLVEINSCQGWRILGWIWINKFES